MEDEAKFPFDVKGFKKAVDQMSKSISSIEPKLNKFGNTMQKSVSKGIMSATAKIGLLVKGFKSIMKNMPEIGQSFKIAGDIISKEFFFPIRQQIIPYLQKMLDWVRDHRALFAKWGQAVADVMEIVIDVGKTLWNTLKGIVEILTNSLQKGLGTSFKSLDEFVSVLQVKIAFVTLLIGDVIKEMFNKMSPTFEFIIEKGSEILDFFTSLVSSWLSLNDNGDSLVTVLDKIYDVFDRIVHIIGNALVGFFEGLVEPLKNLMTPLDNVVESFTRLLDVFGEDDGSGLRNAFKWLGNFTGGALIVVFEELAWAIDTIVVGIQTLAQGGNLLADIFSGNWFKLGEDWENMKNIFESYSKRTSMTGQRQTDAFKSMFSIDDGIVTKDGKVIQLNPQDNVYAFKGTPMGGITAPMNMVFNVTVTEGNAQVVGQQLGYSIHKSFVDRLKEQQMAGGW